MNSLIKVLAPVTLALAAVSAQAGVLEIDYGFPQATSQWSATGAASAASAARATGQDAPLFLIQRSQGAVEVNPAVRDSYTPRSREEVRREATQPRSFDVGYFA